MDKTQFTPGPWSWKEKFGFDEQGNARYAVEPRKKGNWEGVLISDNSKLQKRDQLVLDAEAMADGWGDKADANCNLIASAPDLYEALEYCIKQIPEFADVPGIKAALAKARGGEV